MHALLLYKGIHSFTQFMFYVLAVSYQHDKVQVFLAQVCENVPK